MRGLGQTRLVKGKLISNESCNFLPFSLLLRADFDRMDLDGDKGEDGNRFIDISMFVRLSNLFDGLNNVSVCRIIAQIFIILHRS